MVERFVVDATSLTPGGVVWLRLLGWTGLRDNYLLLMTPPELDKITVWSWSVEEFNKRWDEAEMAGTIC